MGLTMTYVKSAKWRAEIIGSNATDAIAGSTWIVLGYKNYPPKMKNSSVQIVILFKC